MNSQRFQQEGLRVGGRMMEELNKWPEAGCGICCPGMGTQAKEEEASHWRGESHHPVRAVHVAALAIHMKLLLHAARTPRYAGEESCPAQRSR
jgi:hypothetical protein